MYPGNKILFILCAIAAAVGIIIYVEASSFQKTARITQGTVTSTSMSQFELTYTSEDGVERIYKGTHGGKGKRYRDGESVRIFYQIDNPDKCRLIDGKKAGRKVIFWTLILLAFNVFSVYHGKKRAGTEKTFKTTGRKVEAQILRTGLDESHKVLDKIPYSIDCKWTDPMSGREYTHTIIYVWKDPETLLAGKKTIDVYIDRDDPEKYFMDIAFLGDSAK
jgi:hypothetical protein